MDQRLANAVPGGNSQHLIYIIDTWYYGREEIYSAEGAAQTRTFESELRILVVGSSIISSARDTGRDDHSIGVNFHSSGCSLHSAKAGKKPRSITR